MRHGTGGLTMYDDLIKMFRTCAERDSCIGWRESCPYLGTGACDNKAGKAADAIEELSRDLDSMNEANIALYCALPNWIPVSERLPEVRTWVLCYCRANSFDVFRLTDDGNWQYGNRAVYMKGYVTHWMPLPPPPENG
jgi:hypothetical protein